jgi:ATP-dependent Clp protease ATP-binding subunit ClpA
MDIVSRAALVESVKQRAPGTPLERIEAALMISQDLISGADELIGHFVAEARQAGCSWTEIGERIGVSKQAARQRFTRQLPTAGFSGLRQQPRLIACLEAAEREASADGAAEIGTHHQLLGLYQEGVAAAILEKLGIQADQVRHAARELFAGGSAPSELPPPESAEARDAVLGAASLAQRAGLDYVGPQHLLAALALDPGSRARRILGQLDVSIPAIKKELECHISPRTQHRRRPGKMADHRCSFCGRAAAGGARLVAGPAAWICADCITLASEILANDTAGSRE